MLECCDLACVRGDRLLFQRLSLRLGPGESLRVAGPNGAGKTSLLRLVAGLARAEAGEVRWQGASIRQRAEDFRGALLYLGHAAAVSAQLTALENLRFACAVAGLAVDQDACVAALARVGLGGALDLPLAALSQGQRRRAGLARLFLAASRTLWVLDEPFTALDAEAVRLLAAQLAKHCAAGGMVMFATHQDVDVDLGHACRVLDLGDFVGERGHAC
ncbi:cytochrome c biogenesis ATP-binding export protein CcmA [Betaproteobacteria bacterium]|nr:cytochrome c biogenesis ATP-binding export protein CcmA [Betaproteobacteria bacterium]GHU23476.1 cytochrome c biogenesis ATP-binding export protein CcmA [Betaproteobacteria bacterium]GHU23507.1 cytochrome c biogenesis ATP-binding export protein CcmA [Betaproteobacteria bacterium]